MPNEAPQARTIAPDMETLKTFQREQINAWREQAASQPVEVDGLRFDADAAARSNIADMATAIANGVAPDPIAWRDADDVTRSLTQAEFLTMATTVMAQFQGAYQHSFALKDQVSAADTLAGVRAVTWGASPAQ